MFHDKNEKNSVKIIRFSSNIAITVLVFRCQVQGDEWNMLMIH